jgi:hypothetical protein
MNIEKFNELNKEMMKNCYTLLNQKGHDYTNGEQDALYNFKLVATRTGLTPLQVWSVYFTKHIDAIYTYLKKGELKSEPIDSRIQDAINYLLLLNGLIKEKE